MITLINFDIKSYFNEYNNYNKNFSCIDDIKEFDYPTYELFNPTDLEKNIFNDDFTITFNKSKDIDIEYFVNDIYNDEIDKVLRYDNISLFGGSNKLRKKSKSLNKYYNKYYNK